ncbi:hypothetical protein ACWD0G_25140, partial [Streptomyces goshikiensis]
RRRLSTTPAPRTRLLALAGGKEEDPEEEPKPEPEPAQRPATRPAHPGRPVPTPGEVFPPRRKPTPPPKAGRAAG